MGTFCPTDLTGIPAVLADAIPRAPANYSPLLNAAIERDKSAPRIPGFVAGVACPAGGVSSLSYKRFDCGVEITCLARRPYFHEGQITYRAAFDVDDGRVTALMIESGGRSELSLTAREGSWADRPYFDGAFPILPP